MYVEFRFGTTAAVHLINRDLHAWSDKYNIPYKTKIHKLTKRVMFDNVETYSFFALTFEPTSYSSRSWSLIEPMKPPKSN